MPLAAVPTLVVASAPAPYRTNAVNSDTGVKPWKFGIKNSLNISYIFSGAFMPNTFKALPNTTLAAWVKASLAVLTDPLSITRAVS